MHHPEPVPWADAIAAELANQSDLEFLGATVPSIRRAAVAVHREHGDLAHDGVVGLVDALWGREIHELRMAAVELLDLYGDRLTPEDAPLLERMIREWRTWALVDEGGGEEAAGAGGRLARAAAGPGGGAHGA
jgi:hypothetical protein